MNPGLVVPYMNQRVVPSGSLRGGVRCQLREKMVMSVGSVRQNCFSTAKQKTESGGMLSPPHSASSGYITTPAGGGDFFLVAIDSAIFRHHFAELVCLLQL